MKKRILSLALVVVMIAIMLSSFTMAYFTDSDSDVNVMTVGNVEIDQIENFEQGSMIMPTVWATKEVSVKNTGKAEAYIRTIFAFEDTLDASANVSYCVEEHDGGKAITFPSNNTDNWLQILVTDSEGNKTVYTVGYYTYGDAKFAAGATTPLSLIDVGVKPNTGNDFYEKVGGEYDVLVLSQAVQTAGFTSAEAAWTATFGTIDMNSDAKVAEWFAEVLGDGYTVEAFDWATGYKFEDGVPVALKTAQ